MDTSLALRPYAPGDLPTVSDLSQAVGWPHRAQDIGDAFALGQAWVAADEASNEVAGVGAWWDWGERPATLGMMIVSPDHQRRGIGKALFEHLLDTIGEKTVTLVATQEGMPLYEKYGFEAAGLIEQYQGTVTDSRSSPPASDGSEMRAIAADELDVLTSLDERAGGKGRAKLLGNLLAAGQGLVEEMDGTPQGYAVARRFGRGQLVGPVVAGSETQAIALADGLLPEGFVRMDIPASATGLASYLKHRGMTLAGQPVFMHRGALPETAGSLTRYALASQALG